jgi:uncharacterized protein (TIGR02757 family)
VASVSVREQPFVLPKGASEPGRMRDIHAALDRVRCQCDSDARRASDPVAFAHRYRRRDDKELAALIAACMAFGNARVVVAKLDDLFGRLSPGPARAADDEPGLGDRMNGWKHRVFVASDIEWLLLGARAIQRQFGSLGAAFQAGLDRGESLRTALATFRDRIRAAGGVGRRSRGIEHMIPDPLKSSGSKRMLLLLRWMCRPADGVDLGLWDVSPARLLVPVDIHIHRLARNLGFTSRRHVTWETAEDVTGALAQFDPSDPTKYDFSLCHLGMLRRCPSRRDPRLCNGCGIKPVCVHWVTPPSA